MLKLTRRTFAIISLLAVTLLFVDVTGTARHYCGWMAKAQFIPALLAADFLALAILVALTLIFGRIYCSVICPLGIFQDIINRLRIITGGKKKRYRFKYTRPASRLRTGILLVFSILIALGLAGVIAMSIAGLLEPYSAYGRMSGQLLAPLTDMANNALAAKEVDLGSHSFLPVIWQISVPVLIIAAITLVTVTLFAWIGGRDYCNKICPVGTVLGYISKISLFKIKIDSDKCTGCRKCERSCKSHCIDFKTHSIDYTRCVSCFDCIDQCSTSAISYGYAFKTKKPDKTEKAGSPKIETVKETGEVEAETNRNKKFSKGRRNFILSVSALGGALAAHASGAAHGGLAPLKEKKNPVGLSPVTPPGSGGSVRLSSLCTSCQLCIDNCPNSVLTADTSAARFMQPKSEYTKGWCRPECTVCGEICPVGAIQLVTVEDKTAIKIGMAEVDIERCISAAYGQKCGNCSRKCPTGAITMEPMDDTPGAHLRPVVDQSACIGCGACEYNCPVGTAGFISDDYPAIYVTGLRKHQSV